MRYRCFLRYPRRKERGGPGELRATSRVERHLAGRRIRTYMRDGFWYLWPRRWCLLGGPVDPPWPPVVVVPVPAPVPLAEAEAEAEAEAPAAAVGTWLPSSVTFVGSVRPKLVQPRLANDMDRRLPRNVARLLPMAATGEP